VIKTAGSDAKISHVEELLAELRRLSLGPTADVGESSFTIAQLRALAVIQVRQPIAIGALSAALGMSLASGSALVDRLARAAVVRRDHAAEDRRQVLLALTPAGTRFLRRLEQRGQAKLRKALAAMTPHERAALQTAVGAFIRVFREQAGKDQ
jgi:DNA-binding MarR family transcriptional regulator